MALVLGARGLIGRCPRLPCTRAMLYGRDVIRANVTTVFCPPHFHQYGA